MTGEDEALLARIREKKIPWIVAFNKSDLADDTVCPGTEASMPDKERYMKVSAATGEHIYELKELLARQVPDENQGRRLVGDLLKPSDLVVLVVPIDKAAPKGRLILPQQQTIRDILDADAISVVVKENELKHTLESIGRKPRMVITDSQAFRQVAADTPEEILLTSFSILFARYKGELEPFAEGVKTLDEIQDGDKILISEGCTHHRQCDDIGTVKLPNWIRKYTGKEPEFVFTSGVEFPDDLSPYRMIIHCGGCTLNAREMRYRIACAADAKIPIANYGMAIAYMNGILERSLRGIQKI
jgi:[FeFe] hydrogenase H-cluster maturation GTPase HydF